MPTRVTNYDAGCKRMSARMSTLGDAVAEDDERCRDTRSTPFKGDASILETI